MTATCKDLNDNDYVSYEAGMALHSIGFDISTRTGWIIGKNARISRPVLQKALQWLRGEYKVSLRINWSSVAQGWFYDYLDIADDNYMDSTEYFGEYNDAVNAGIINACEYIKSKLK